MRHELFYESRQKARQAVFHHSTCLLFASPQRLILSAQWYLTRFFSKSWIGMATAKHNNIEEGIQ